MDFLNFGNLKLSNDKLFQAHIGICGSTGAGKTRLASATLLKELLEKQPKAPDGSPWAVVIIDSNSEYYPFADNYSDKVIVFSPDVEKGVPFRISSKNVTIDEITVFLREITKKDLGKGDLANLFLAIDELRSKGDYSLEQVYVRLYELQAYSLLPAFEKMMQTGIFGPEETPLNLLVRPGQASIIDLGGLPIEIQSIVVAHLARRLFYARTKAEIPPTILWLEEAASHAPEGTLAPSSQIIHTIATQGRGYYLILVSIFQRPSMISKNVLSQTLNYFIGRLANPLDRQAILRSAEKIEVEHNNIIKNLKVPDREDPTGEFLVTGFIVDEPTVVKLNDLNLIGAKGGKIKQKAMQTTFERADLIEYIQSVRNLEHNLRQRLEEELKKIRVEREEATKPPAMPKEAEREVKKLKERLEAAEKRYQEAIARADKRAKERYESRIKELEDEVERLTKQLTIKGVETPTVWDHPLIQKRLSEKLTEQQRNLVEFLEKAGPSNVEKISAYIGCAPKTVPSYISQINKAIPNLIVYDSRSGVYKSRLSEIFPVSVEVKPKEQELLAKIAELSRENEALRKELEAAKREDVAAKLAEKDRALIEVRKELEEAKSTLNELRSKLKSFEALSLALQNIVHEPVLKGLKEEIVNEVITRISALPNVTVIQPKEALLKSVLMAEINKVRSEVQRLNDKSRLMLSYLAAIGKAVKVSELLIRFVGSDGGTTRKQYIEPLISLQNVVKYDKNHGTISFVWRERLKEAYPSLSDEEIDAAIGELHYILQSVLSES